jgi:putative NADH-flavin reductase
MAEIAVLGAGGRAGRAVVAEAIARGHTVTAIVRDPTRHADLEAVAADALDAGAVRRAAAGARAVVNAVAPFSGPPASFDGFDPAYFRRIADAMLAVPARLVGIGLFATLHDPAGRPLMDDPDRFPPALLPYARAHAAGVERLHETDADWVVLTPPPLLTDEAPRTGRYALGDRTVDSDRLERPLSYADLAVAALDQIERPTRAGQVAVYAAA